MKRGFLETSDSICAVPVGFQRLDPISPPLQETKLARTQIQSSVWFTAISYGSSAAQHNTDYKPCLTNQGIVPGLELF